MILFTCDEGPYLLNETRHAIRSLARANPDEPVMFMLVGGSGVYDKASLGWHPRLEIRHYQPADVGLEAGAPGFHFAFKALVMDRIREECRGPLLFLDGDILVRRSLEGLFRALEPYDLMVRLRPELELLGPMGTMESAKLNTGVMAIADTESGREYISFCRDLIEAHLRAGGAPMLELEENKVLTTIDQEGMWLARLELGDKLRFCPLNDRFNDSYFRRSSAIWHAKGRARKHAMSRYGIDAYEAPIGAAFTHRKVLLDHFLEDRATDRLHRDMLAKFFALEESALARRGLERSDINKKRVLALSSDFVTQNPWLQAARELVVRDWDPAAYHRNQSRLEGCPNISHRFCERPLELPFKEFDLVLSDLPLDAPHLSVPSVVRATDIRDRFQWNHVVRRRRMAERARKNKQPVESFCPPELSYLNFPEGD